MRQLLKDSVSQELGWTGSFSGIVIPVPALFSWVGVGVGGLCLLGPATRGQHQLRLNTWDPGTKVIQSLGILYLHLGLWVMPFSGGSSA